MGVLHAPAVMGDLPYLGTAFFFVRIFLSYLRKASVKYRHFMFDLETKFRVLVKCAGTGSGLIGRFKTNGLITVNTETPFLGDSHPAVPHTVLNVVTAENNQAVFENFSVDLETHPSLILCTICVQRPH